MWRIPATQLKKIKSHIQKGGVIAYPTESCYGLGCDPFNPHAIKKILCLKKRPISKGLIVIAGDKSQLKDLLMPLDEITQQELSKYWPGFFSIILPVLHKAPRILTGKHSNIAVRVTRHQLVQRLTKSLGHALVSTSANKSGKKPLTTYRACNRQFGKQVLVINGITNFAKRQSTIIDWAAKKITR